MATGRKRISELTALSSASLDTVIVGVDNGTTYKIELDVLADAVTSRVNILDRDRLQSLEYVTSSFETKGRSIVSGSSQLTSSYDLRYVISGSITQTTWDNIANKPDGIVSQSTDLSSLNTFTQSIDSRVDSLENSTGSYLTNLNGAISSSSQLTSSFDVRYTLSGSITETTWNNISGKPSGIVSQSTDLTSLNQFTQSIDGRVDSLENATSSFETKGSGIISGAAQITSLGYSKLVGGNTFYNEQTFLNNVNIQGNLSSSVINNLNSFTQSFSTSVDSRFDTLEATIISGSPNYTQVLGNRRTGITTTGVSIISGSITTTGNPVQIMVTGDANPIGGTGWARLQIFRDGNGIGNIIQVENSSNLNVPYCLNVIDTPSAGTYTYSMRTTDAHAGTFDFGEVNGPLLTVVELKTNTNLPSTNNVFTGTNAFNGGVTIGPGAGFEGGELALAYAPSGTTLTGSAVVLDVYQDRVRIFENSGNFRGVHIDMSKAPTGVSGELIWKTSGFVNAGTFLTLDNLKVSVTTGGSRGLSVGAVSTNFTANISGWFGYTGGGGGASAVNIGYTTTGSSSAFGWSFTTEGDGSNYIINDKTNNRVYRVTLMIGAGYNNNFISIERLY